MRAFLDDVHPDDVWYFVHDGRAEGAGYFVGYEKVDKRRIGFIDQRGFGVDRPPRDKWFPVKRTLVLNPFIKLWTSIGVNKAAAGVQLDSFEKSSIPPHLVYVPSGHELKEVDLSTRTVRTVLTTPEPIEGIDVAAHLTPFDTLGVPQSDQAASVPAKSARPNEQSRGVEAPSQKSEDRSNDAAVAAMTAHKIYVLDRDLRQRTIFAIPDEARGPVELYLPQGWAVAFIPNAATSEHKLTRRDMLYQIAPDGTIRDHRLVETHFRELQPWNERPEATLLPLALPSPAILWFVEPLVIARAELSAGYVGGFSVMFRDTGVLLLVLAMFIATLASLTWRRSVAYSLSLGERLAWSAFVVLFGLGGYVGFLLHRRWPLREECPNCHAQTVVERGGCTRCGEGFPQKWQFAARAAHISRLPCRW
jgi:hypothetical protein